jgi:hypothetical protein
MRRAGAVGAGAEAAMMKILLPFPQARSGGDRARIIVIAGDGLDIARKDVSSGRKGKVEGGSFSIEQVEKGDVEYMDTRGKWKSSRDNVGKTQDVHYDGG